jgi:dihydrofolate synthase / folylpolyglutamate synthase
MAITYPDSVQFLYALGNELRSVKFGLEGITRLMEAMGYPEQSTQFVHVAGTNGKGSTSAMIESALRASGMHTGLFTSPHLSQPTERIQIDGVPITAEEFARAFQTVHEAAETLLRDEQIATHPTYFETVTAMAFHCFRERGVEMAVLEVGLGGRLDATNVVPPPRVAVITPVDYDHEKFLGTTLRAIAGEKAGILKPGTRAVFAPQRTEAEEVLEARARELGIDPIWTARRYAVEDLELHAHGSRFAMLEPSSGWTLRIDCPLAGGHQVENCVAAAAVLRVLGIEDETLAEGIRKARWPGRLERVATRPDIILDGAHNPSGARALARHIRRFYSGRRVWLIFGAMRDKSVDEMTGVLAPLASELILTAPRQLRAVRPEALRNLLHAPESRVAADIGEALQIVEHAAGEEDVVFITGSLFTVAEAREILMNR